MENLVHNVIRHSSCFFLFFFVFFVFFFCCFFVVVVVFIFWVLLQQLLCNLHPRMFLLIGEKIRNSASTYLRNLKNFLQNEVERR